MNNLPHAIAPSSRPRPRARPRLRLRPPRLRQFRSDLQLTNPKDESCLSGASPVPHTGPAIAQILAALSLSRPVIERPLVYS